MTTDAGQATLEDVLAELTERFSGKVGYVFTNLSTGARVAHDDDVEFPTASTIKLPILTTLHEHVRRTGMDLDELVPVNRLEIAGGSGILQYLSRTLTMSYRDLAWLMICLSDNTATNLVIDAIGRERVGQLLAEVVDPAVRLRGMAGAGLDREHPSMGYATAAALGDYLERLARRQLPGADETIAVASQQVYESMIPRYLPLSPHAAVPLKVAHKTGALPGVRADIGLVSSASITVTVAVLTSDADDLSYDTMHEGQAYIGAMTYAVCRAWLGISSNAGERALAAA